MDALPPVAVSPFGIECTYFPLPPRPTMRAICEEVARKHGMTFAELCSQRRRREVVRARWEAMWRCHRETSASMPMIGRVLGNKDHTTVLNGIRKFQAMIDARPA